MWTEDAPSGLAQVKPDNAEAERLINEGWKVIATSPTTSAYAIHLVMKRKKNA
jgi:hypothetical protein